MANTRHVTVAYLTENKQTSKWCSALKTHCNLPRLLQYRSVRTK